MLLQTSGSKSRPRIPIGESIRSRREELGLTLKKLAERSGLSAPFLSQAERDLTVPSLISLLAIADALEVEISYFMTIAESPDIVHRAAEPNIINVDSPVVYVDLSTRLPNRKLDIHLTRIPPGHVFPVDRRNGEDFLYVISGELEASVGETRTVLKAGDSMHFDSRLPHSARNLSEAEVVLLYVGTPSVFKKERAPA